MFMYLRETPDIPVSLFLPFLCCGIQALYLNGTDDDAIAFSNSCDHIEADIPLWKEDIPMSIAQQTRNIHLCKVISGFRSRHGQIRR